MFSLKIPLYVCIQLYINDVRIESKGNQIEKEDMNNTVLFNADKLNVHEGRKENLSGRKENRFIIVRENNRPAYIT